MIIKSTASKLTWNISTLFEMMKKRKLNFDTPIQRGYVWDSKRKSLFIHSILIEWPTSVFYLNRVNKTLYEGLEGKQRSNAIYEYIDGNYALYSKTPPIITDEGETIQVAKRKFNDLPGVLKDKILQYGLDIYSFEDMSIDEKIEFFIRINSGKPATAAEIGRIKVKSRDVFLSLVEHEAIVSSVSKANRLKGVDEDIVENIWCMCYNENPSLLKSHTSKILATTDVTDEQKKEIIRALDYLAVLFKSVGSEKQVSAKMKKLTHIVSLAYMGHLANKKGIDEMEFCKKARALFNGEGKTVTVSKAYNTSVGSGSAKPESVKIRMVELEKALD